MRNNKDNFVYVGHIHNCIEKISGYTSNHNYKDFTSNEWDQAAIIRYFEVIGEATTKIDDDFKKDHPEIEWLDMSDFRNFLIHDYMDIDVKVVWDTVTNDIPKLKERIEDLLKQRPI